ncbi:transcription termination factor Rho [Akkermansiaceae bacterium]|nr:transcription termination factor Rho [Akkermansiaceae bacterium]
MSEEKSLDDLNAEFEATKNAEAKKNSAAKPKAEKTTKAKKSEDALESDSPANTEATEASEQTEKKEVIEEAPKYDIPESININEFRERPLAEVYTILEALPVRIQANATKAQLIYDILTFYGKGGCHITVSGIAEQAKDSYAMLRDPKRSFKTSPDDVYLGGEFIKKFGIKPGHQVTVSIRAPRPRDKYLSAEEVLKIEGLPAEEFEEGIDFEKLTPLFPEDRLILDSPEGESKAVRIVDLVAPLGKGQRGIIVAPPRGGKTILLKQIAKAIAANHPEVHLIVMLLDERPEEVSDFEDTVNAEVFSSTFDEPAKRHTQVADLVLERSKRLVEQKKDVVILLDSLTRLARGHNNAQSGGPIGSGGVNQNAMQKSRKFFGTARNVDEGGSLTVLATALIETESRLDDVIFEEFKGTGNMEIRLDRDLAERRIFPAIHIPQSGTRNDDRLYHPDEFRKVVEVRKHLAALPVGEAIEVILRQLEGTQTNAEFLMRGLR